MRKRKLIFLGLLLMAVGLVSIAHLFKPPLEDGCTGVGYLSSNRAITNVHAVKVVVEPLLGRHQVYGIFLLDREKCPPGQPVILTVVGAGKYCEATNPVAQQFEGIEAAPGYYLSQHYIRTRTAVWLSIQGMLEQLKQPQNWTLTYAQ